MSDTRNDDAASYLIVALSARFIAESAVRGYYPIVTVDGFADEDLQALVKHIIRVPLKQGALDNSALLEVFEKMCARHSLAGFVVGPGLEHCDETLARMSADLPLLGNDCDVYKQCNQRSRMAELLSELDIPTPLQYSGNMDTAVYLSKQSQTCGGSHIRFNTPDVSADFCEPYIPAATVSHLFLANNVDVVSVGFNTLWHSHHDADKPFCYGGAINRSPMEINLKQKMIAHARRAVQHLGLKGLNNMDYLLSAGRLYCLELNPRPSATMQINDSRFEYQHGKRYEYLFGAHLRAAAGELPMQPVADDCSPTAHAHIYVRRNLCVSPTVRWPKGTRDIPAAGNQFEPGQVLCSMTASAPTVSATLTQLQNKIKAVAASFPSDIFA